MPQGQEVGSIFVSLGLDMSEMRAGVAAANQTLDNLGRQLESTGRKLTMAITAPALAAGGAAVKSAAEMEDALAQAQSTAGLTDQALQQIARSSEEIAVSTGQSFEKVVEAYKFAQSAGLDLAESQEIVETAAKAAAAGFGNQTTLLRGMTTVMAGYGDEAGSATEIMDKMVATAQSMEVEVPALTEVMGQLVQVASETGVSFDEMLAAVGSVGEQFGDVSRAGNLMSTALTQLLDPSQKVRDLMKEVGTSADEVRANIEEDGITRAMSALREQTEAAGIEFASMVGSARSARVMLALTSNEGSRVAEIMGEAKDSTGALNDAFQDSQSFSRLLSQSWQALRTSLRPLGDVLIDTLTPALSSMIGEVQDLSDRFKSMSREAKANAIAITALAAAAGPAAFALGKLLRAVASLNAALLALSGPVGATVGVLAAVGVVTGVIINRWEEFRSYFQRMFDSIVSTAEAGTDLIKLSWQFMVQAMRSTFARLGESVAGFFADIASMAASWGVDAAAPWATAFTAVRGQMKEASSSAQSNMKALSGAIESTSETFQSSFVASLVQMMGVNEKFALEFQNTWEQVLGYLGGQFRSFRDMFLPQPQGGGDQEEPAAPPAPPEDTETSGVAGLLPSSVEPLRNVDKRLQSIKDSASALSGVDLKSLTLNIFGLSEGMARAEQRAARIRDRMKELADGEQTKQTREQMSALRQELKMAEFQATALGQSLSKAMQVGTQALTKGFQQLLRFGGASAEAQLQVLQLQQRLQNLQEKDSTPIVRKRIEVVRQRLEEARQATKPLASAFQAMGNAIVQVLSQVIAKLTTAVAIAGVLSALTSRSFGGVFGALMGIGGGGGGGFVGTGISGGGLGVPSMASRGPGALQVQVTGESRVEGRSIKTVYDTETRAQRRKGHSSR